MTKSRMIKVLIVAATLLFCLSSAQLARADNVQTLPEFNGTNSCTDVGSIPCSEPPVVFGTFDILPGDNSITISGTFGNSTVPNSSGVDLYLGSIPVASCAEYKPCYFGTTAWSDSLTLGQIESLGTGVVDFTAVQTSQYIIRLGVTTLDQVTPAAVPEPSTWLLLGTGVLALLGFARKKAILRPCA
jgi:PEP-CTERM motif